MDTGPCFNDPHPANKRVDMALVDVAATEIVVEDLIMMKNLDYGYRYPVSSQIKSQVPVKSSLYMYISLT
jgi:hypothetical protein